MKHASLRMSRYDHRTSPRNPLGRTTVQTTVHWRSVDVLGLPGEHSKALRKCPKMITVVLPSLNLTLTSKHPSLSKCVSQPSRPNLISLDDRVSKAWHVTNIHSRISDAKGRVFYNKCERPQAATRSKKLGTKPRGQANSG
jgi:hypothetical protein